MKRYEMAGIAADNAMDTKLNFPILLVHGMGFRDDKRFSYWGRIPQALEEMGCRVYFGAQDGNADVETNAAHLAQRIQQILEETGAEKVNIIAHSKGGLDIRYAISVLGMAPKVASLTTLATPHHGSKTVDLLMKLPDPLIRFAGFCADRWCRILGDKHPHSYKVFHSFTTQSAAQFNADTPDREGVFYQSCAFVMKHPFSDFLMWFPNLIVGWIDGENDGLLSPASVQWGHVLGVYRGTGRRGVSHMDEVDFRRRPLSMTSGSGSCDILDVYREIVLALIQRGF